MSKLSFSKAVDLYEIAAEKQGEAPAVIDEDLSQQDEYGGWALVSVSGRQEAELTPGGHAVVGVKLRALSYTGARRNFVDGGRAK